MKKSLAQTWAQQSKARSRVFDKVLAEKRAEADATNAADAKQLTALDSEIDNLERRASQCDETAIAMLPVKRDLRPHLAAKLATDAQKRLADVATTTRNDPRLPAVTVDYSFDQLLNDAWRELHQDMKRHHRDDLRSERVANDSDAGGVLRRLRNGNYADAERNEIIEAIANGQNPPWIFT